MGRQHVGRGRPRPLSASTKGPADDAGQQRYELRLGNLEWTSPGSPERSARRRRHRTFRQVRRVVGAGMAFALLGGIVFAALLLVTPSVANAPRLVRQLQQVHNSQLAGHLPARFSAAMQALQDRGRPARGSMAGVMEFVGQLVRPPTRNKPAVDQQLASMLYLRKNKGQIAQIEQAVLVLKLHWSYSDSALIRMFARIASFGHGYYGLAAASCGYFGQRPGHLSWGQIAILAAIAANPATDDPYEHVAHARRDQAAVLRALAAAGTFSRGQAAKIANESPHLRGMLARSRHYEPGVCR